MSELNESLGHYLRKEREQKSISLEQVAYATRINLKMLHALENDDHNSLPAQTFVRGYLQAYAKYVKLDIQDVLLRYQHLLATTPVKQRSALKSHYVYVKERYQEKRQLLLIISLFSVFLLSAGTYFVLKSKRDHKKMIAQQAHSLNQQETAAPETMITVLPPYAPTIIGMNAQAANTVKVDPATAITATPTPEASEEPKTAAKEVVKEKEISKKPSPTPTPSKAASSTPAPLPGEKKNYVLVLKAKEDVWFRFQTDEDPVRDLKVKADKIMTLKANKVIKMFSAHWDKFEATFNGQVMEKLSPNPELVKSVVLPQSETGNYPRPLFPQFEKKSEASASSPAKN